MRNFARTCRRWHIPAAARRISIGNRLRRTSETAGKERIAAISGRRPFKNLQKKLTPQQRVNIARKAAALREEMTLAELRQARLLPQETLGEMLQVGQTSIAKMEKRADMYVSNQRRFIEAMGGQLDIVARFLEGAVKIANFSEIEEKASEITGRCSGLQAGRNVSETTELGNISPATKIRVLACNASFAKAARFAIIVAAIGLVGCSPGASIAQPSTAHMHVKN
jgi:hypothetical protein